ncbi:MAG TPA: hypothetical protein VIL60_12345 [Rhodanobacter sp.]
MHGFDLLSTVFGRAEKLSADPQSQASQDEVGVTVRYRMSLVSDIQRWHASASGHMRALLDACRDQDPDRAIECLQRFAPIFRQIGLARSVLLCPYLRWALQRDRAATIQFESAYGELMRSTLLIEVILTDYLGSPWDSDRRRRFVHVVVRLANLFSRGMELENTSLLSIYLPPGQYRYVTDPAIKPVQPSA